MAAGGILRTLRAYFSLSRTAELDRRESELAGKDRALAAKVKQRHGPDGIYLVTKVLPDGGYIIKNARESCARLVQERDLHATKLDPSP